MINTLKILPSSNKGFQKMKESQRHISSCVTCYNSTFRIISKFYIDIILILNKNILFKNEIKDINTKNKKMI